MTRGVLLDVAGQKGVEALDPGEGISGEDLDSAERAAGAEVMAGDTVFVGLRAPEDAWARSGRATRRLARCSSGVVAPPLCLGLFR